MKSPRRGGTSKLVPKLKTKIYKLEQEVKDLMNKKTIEIIKEVPVEIIKEVRIPERIEVPIEIIKEVPYEVIKEVPKEVIREVIKEIKVPERIEIIKEVPYEVIKEIRVDVPYEVIKEVPYEVIKEVQVPFEVEVEVIREVPYDVIKEVKVFVPTENLEAKKRWKDELDRLQEEKQKQKKDLEDKITFENNAKNALENRYQAAIHLMKALNDRKIMMFEKQVASDDEKYKHLSTYAYLTIPYILSQILFWMVT